MQPCVVSGRAQRGCPVVSVQNLVFDLQVIQYTSFRASDLYAVLTQVCPSFRSARQSVQRPNLLTAARCAGPILVHMCIL